MNILGIDPGPSETAWALLGDDACVMEFGCLPNAEVLDKIRDYANWHDMRCNIEMIASYGMAVGAEVFETCLWVGRFAAAWDYQARDNPAKLIYRRTIKMHLCGSNAAKDANVRQALIDRYGPGREKAIGTKKKPGPLKGIAGDVWAALAVAVTAYDQLIG